MFHLLGGTDKAIYFPHETVKTVVITLFHRCKLNVSINIVTYYVTYPSSN